MPRLANLRPGPLPGHYPASHWLDFRREARFSLDSFAAGLPPAPWSVAANTVAGDY